MEKQKRWQFVLIAVVVILTLYNILPTVLFYSKPLNGPITENRATTVAQGVINRVNALEDESLSWLKSYNKLLGTKPSSITLNADNPEIIHIRYQNEKDAERVKNHLPRAGSLIPFVPAQLSLIPNEKGEESTLVTIQRKIPIHFDGSKTNEYFSFTEKRDSEGKITPLYHQIVDDRLVQLGLAVGGISENAQYLETVIHHQGNPRAGEFLQILAQNILTYAKIFGEHSPIAKRYYSTVTQGSMENKPVAIAQLIGNLERYKDQIKLQRIALEDTENAKREKGGFLEANEQQQLDYFKTREESLGTAIGIARRQRAAFNSSANPWTYTKLKQDLGLASKNNEPIETLLVGGRSPLVKAINIDWNNEQISLELHEDILSYKEEIERSKSYLNDQLDQLIYNEIARIARETGEKLTPYQNTFAIELNRLTNSQSLLVMDLGAVAKTQAEELFHLIRTQWNPSHPDLKRSSFPIYDYQTYVKLSPHHQKIGLVVYAPAELETEPPAGFRNNSVYIIAKGIQEILGKLEENPNSPQAKAFIEDFSELRVLLQNNGFIGYPGSTYPLNGIFAKDFIFEAEDFYHNIISATREEFTVYGTRKFATLEFTNVEQRILALNRIETKMHEDLLKWRDEYQAAQVKEEFPAKYDIPAPTKNPLRSNLALSARKYFRGDERKILHWGLDLSGGKTVQIQLRDSNNKVVTNDADIEQGIDELYNRVNKMGVSEVSVRQEGSNITLDFPSAQDLSAADLVKASSMYFHIVNEKFSTYNTELAPFIHRFLQDIWNEAIVTNRKDIDSINQIAWKHFYGDTLDTEMAQPVSEAAKTLYNQGLRLSNPNDTVTNSTFNDSISKLAIFRGDNYADWQGQTHPLLVVMKNYALEGANLTNIHASYDPTRGNFLAFNVKGSQTLSDGQKINPRNDLYNWTTPFSKEKVQGTSLDKFSRGEGWRMAVILNGSIVNTATISSPLKDNVSISGSFTQREANRLEADLKAGSLSFAPHILSEKNVSPELGLKDRTMGILATIIALVLVIFIMIGYYRFAGVIASIALLVNLLIIWATLVNISATVTLAGIAGIILTVGMAVDANVLVFERIREEFAVSGRIASAVHAGYRKAFSAIIDSNITTIIAALILLQFDSGPIKGFAVTLIIGIVSSMFTALFITRYFFAGWVQNPTNKALKMANLIKKTRFNFLRYGKVSLYSLIAIILVGGYLLVSERNSMLGMDFTGGYSVTLEIEAKADKDYQKKVEKALIGAGATAQDIQVRTLSSSNNIKILLGRNLDQMGRPFENMPLETDNKDVSFQYQNNPRLAWVVNALESDGLELTPQSLKTLDTHWTSISGQISNAMRNNAVIGLAVALLCILIYITFRFELKYAISATLGLAIDVGITVAFMSILHAIGTPIQIDLNTIAAIMTIIGYSLNDTIIIFDRIRDDLKHMRKHSFKDVVNHALNVTLSRTVMTSGTTLVVLLALLFLGGSTIFGLSLVMVIGVVFGTFSSLYVAAPLLLFFHRKEKAKAEKVALHEN
ncbi:MAG: protein translocase subunit SecD [Candidatus Neptunochlamydia sp.]|nr:protein translocase subunit SecD [Candidatus Neptunochlamydia sp.]